jgi:hypothetical protein
MTQSAIGLDKNFRAKTMTKSLNLTRIISFYSSY